MSDRPTPAGPSGQQEKPPSAPRVIRGFNGRFDTRPPPEEPQLPAWLFPDPSRHREALDALDARYREVEAVVASLMSQNESPDSTATMDAQRDEAGEERARVEGGSMGAGGEGDIGEWGSTPGTLVNVVALREREGEWEETAITLVNGMMRQERFREMAMASRGPYIDPEGGPAFMGWPPTYDDEDAVSSSGTWDRSTQHSPLFSLGPPALPLPDPRPLPVPDQLPDRIILPDLPLPTPVDDAAATPASLEYCPFEMEEDWLHGGTGIL